MNVTLEGGMKPKSHHQREFNVLTNKYNENHDSRELSDFEQQRTSLGEKYWKNHDYDILAGRYCDVQKEGRYEEGLRAKEKVHGQKQKAKLPPSVKYSEGNVYDIVNNEVRDHATIGGVDDRRNKSVASKKTSIIEDQIRTKALADSDALETRAMNRIHPDRYRIERHVGYDPITNISHGGREGVPPAPLRQQDKVAVWAKLHEVGPGARYSHSAGGGGGGASGGGGANGGGVSKPRDLSNGSNNNNNGGGGGVVNPNAMQVPKPGNMSDRSGRGQTPKSGNPNRFSETVKPGFVPSLTIPSGGMVDGKLDMTQN
jgi:hypothetical protein